MQKLPQISEAEYEVMKVIWQYAPISTNEVTDQLVDKKQWNPKTVHTLLKRLVSKNAITYEKKGRLFVYTPLIEEKCYVQQQSQSFLKRFYNGSMERLLISYLDSQNLSDDDIHSLQMILENHSQNKDK